MRMIDRILGLSIAGPSKEFVQPPPFWSLNTEPLWLSSLGDKERIANDFPGYVQDAYKSNGIVFACMLTRGLLLSEARFLWREFQNGRPGNLFGTPSLSLLEKPWPNCTTGGLIMRMDVDVSLAGNSYLTTVDDAGNFGKVANGPTRRMVRMRPDWVHILIGSKSGDPQALDRRILAYIYESRGMFGGSPSTSSHPVMLLPNEVCHYAPIPDPIANYRGMSWLTPLVREVEADSAATKHKLKFFENGAHPGIIARAPKETSPERFKQYVELFKERKTGVDNAYGTMFLGGGFDVDILGRDFAQLEFKVTQGAGETRIAAVARIPPSIVGLSEGLQGSTLNAGNFNVARRLCAQSFLRPSWREIAGSLETLVPPPRPNVGLWFDERDIAFLREDEKDVAEIQAMQAQIIRTLSDAGFTSDSITAALAANDWSLLVHSGLFSVQLQPPGTIASSNGAVPVPVNG